MKGPSTLLLSGCKRLGQGTVKAVYQHPRQAHQVIKIIQTELVAADGGFTQHSGWKRRLHQGVYRQFRREIIQYLQLCKNHYGSGQFVFPMETPYGLQATDLGLGLVVEKISGPDGQGWTLEALAHNGLLQSQHYQALERFFDDCVRLHLVFGEVNIAGLMYTEERNNRPEFVLVDGIGEKLMIPIRAMSAHISGRYVRRVQRRIMQEVQELVAPHQN